MATAEFTVTPIAPALGAVVTGIDLSRPVLDAAFAEIEAAFHAHLVLFFENQRLTSDQFAAFAGRFGPIGRYPFAKPLPEHPEIIPVIKEADQRTNFGGVWHSDTTYLERPPLGSLLYALEVPPIGGDTLFANMYLAYEALSDGMKRLLDGLTVVNSANKDSVALRGAHLAAGMAGRDLDKMTLEATHPAVRMHPVTGRKGLYVNRAHSLRFSGMTEAESAPLLDYLYRHAVREEFTCRYRWSVGALAVWDNRCTQHYPLNDYHGHRRALHRITIEGERPA